METKADFAMKHSIQQFPAVGMDSGMAQEGKWLWVKRIEFYVCTSVLFCEQKEQMKVASQSSDSISLSSVIHLVELLSNPAMISE